MKYDNYGDCIKNYYQIYENLKELSLNMFKWEGLPESIDKDYLEETLFEEGKIGFFKDDVLNQFLALKVTSTGNLNVYGKPKEFNAIGQGASWFNLKKDDEIFIIKNNKTQSTTKQRLLEYAKEIFLIEKTINLNVYNQKTPILIKTNKKTEFTLKNLFKKYDGFDPMMFVDQGLDLEGVTVLNTQVEFKGNELYELRRKIYNECLSYIGIENNYSEKRERLTADEVLISNGLAISNRNSKLKAREEEVEKINKKFDLNIKIEYNNISVVDILQGDEVEDDGTI